MARLRQGRAITARGAAHFLRETVGRVRHAGARGQLTLRADSGFYTHAIVAVCRKLDVRFSITIRQHQSLRNLIEAIPEGDWTPVPYWMDGAADLAETSYTPFQGEPDAAPVRLIVRRVKPTPGSQLALFATYSYHAFITDRDGDTLDIEADHRRHAEIENAIRDLKYGVGLNHLPSGRFPANAAWLAVQVMAHNLARWTARIGLGQQIVTTKTLRRRVFALAGRITRSARRITLHLAQRWPWKPSSVAPWPDCEPFHSQPDCARPPLTRHPANRTPRQLAPVRSASASCRVLSRHPTHHSHCKPPSAPPTAPADRRQPPVYPNSSPDHRACNFLTPLPLSSRRPSVSTGGFGLTLTLSSLAPKWAPFHLPCRPRSSGRWYTIPPPQWYGLPTPLTPVPAASGALPKNSRQGDGALQAFEVGFGVPVGGLQADYEASARFPETETRNLVDAHSSWWRLRAEAVNSYLKMPFWRALVG